MATPLDFAKALLNRLGLPQTQNRLVGLVAFESKEGGHFANPASRYNPLNTCRGVPGSRNWGGPGCIQAFPSWQAGVEATALTMVQPNMAALLNALKADAAPMAFLQAVTDTPWCPRVDANGNPTDCASYATGDPYAAYKSYANHPDPVGGALATTQTAGPMGWVKDHPYMTAGLGLLAAAAAVYFLRPDIFREFPVVGRFAARENPVRRRERGGSRVQTLIFPRSRFTPAEAKAWAHAHNFKAGKLDVTDQSIRIRQEDPSHFSRMRTIRMGGSPVQAVVGFPR